jgi:hypothetical protein
MLFIAELARRGVRAYASDPGLALTDITRDGPALLRWLGRPTRARGLTSHPAAAGAASTLMAVTTDQPSGTYFAPWMFSLYGRPRRRRPRQGPGSGDGPRAVGAFRRADRM